MKVAIERKLIRRILPVTLGAFVVCFGIFLFMNLRVQGNHEISQQMEQTAQAASQILMVQKTVKNIADFLDWDEDLKNQFPQPSDTVGRFLAKKRKVHNTLAGYAHLSDQIEEILLYLDETEELPAQTFTSREIRNDFMPEKEEWFAQFTGQTLASGYSGIHLSSPQQNGYVAKVVSYVTPYYGASYTGGRIGYLIINIFQSDLSDIAHVESDMVEGYWLLDGQGRMIAGSEEAVPVPEDSVPDGAREAIEAMEAAATGDQNGTDSAFRNSSGTVFLANTNLEGGWKLIRRLSKRELLRESLQAFLPVLLLLPIIMLFLILALQRLIRRMMAPINELTAAATEVGAGNLDLQVDIRTGDELEILADAFNKMVADVKDYTSESLAHEKKIQQMNTENLLLQINPHFIYNTLNSIVYMARMGGNEQIADFTSAFISLLQQTLRVRNSMENRLSDELDVARAYIRLQNYRYENKLHVEMDCPPGLLGCAVPSMLLQPLAENAIFHGLAPKEGPGTLSIRAISEGEDLIVQVADDGIGMQPETVQELMSPDYIQQGGVHRIGLGNVRRRIREMYGEEYDLMVESIPGEGTVITARVPLTYLPAVTKEGTAL